MWVRCTYEVPFTTKTVFGNTRSFIVALQAVSVYKIIRLHILEGSTRYNYLLNNIKYETTHGTHNHT